MGRAAAVGVLEEFTADFSSLGTPSTTFSRAAWLIHQENQALLAAVMATVKD